MGGRLSGRGGEEEPGEILSDLPAEDGGRDAAELGEGAQRRGEVGGMVGRGAVGCGEWREGLVFGGQAHGGGVGLDEEALLGDELKHGATGGVVRPEEGAVEGEIGAEVGEGADEIGRPTVGVEEEADRRQPGVAQEVVEGAEGIEAMERGGPAEFSGEGELGGADLGLFGEGRAAEAGEAGVVGAGAVEHPAVETELADGGGGVAFEPGAEGGVPGGGAVAAIPRVEPVAGQHPGVGGGEGGDGGPIGFAGAVDDGAGEAEGGEVGGEGGEVGGERLVVGVVVRVVERGHGRQRGAGRVVWHDGKAAAGARKPPGAGVRAQAGWGSGRYPGKPRKETHPMMDNLLIDLPELKLPRDLAWRVRFIEAVEDHARRLGIVGRYQPTRFMGYYFAGPNPVVVSGHWTVTLDDVPLLRSVREMIERMTELRFSIRSNSVDLSPEFMLVHDRQDGSCWLWEYAQGRRFLEARQPVASWCGGSGDYGDEAGPKLLGP